jgi:hypothetical protein
MSCHIGIPRPQGPGAHPLFGDVEHYSVCHLIAMRLTLRLANRSEPGVPAGCGAKGGARRLGRSGVPWNQPGVEFIDENGGGPGVRLRKRT